jgi:cystathionine beta-synthase
MANIHTDVLELIGNTPMVQLKGFDTGPCRLLAKLECQNPAGSIKDRIGLSMISAAEAEGKIGSGSTLVEATAGNTGLGLALVAARKGYRLILVIPDKMSREKVLHLKAMGADVVTTRSDVGKGHPDYYMDLAESIAAKTPKAWFVNQFGNPANPVAHVSGTGPEIWRQTGGRLDAVVCGVGSGGTMTGLSRFFAGVAPHVQMVLADPVGSALAEYVKTGKATHGGSYLVEGIGGSHPPPIADLSRVADAYSISDEESFATARRLLLENGILAGSSSGTLVAAALRWCRKQTSPKTVVTFVCDTGGKYMSKLFNDTWMIEQGLIRHAPTGDLRDLIPRRPAEGTVVSVAPQDSLGTAYARMRLNDVSQLPVLDAAAAAGGRIVGLIDESDLLVAALSDPHVFGRGVVKDFMTTRLKTVPPTAPIEALTEILNAGLVAIVADDSGFHGLITRVDLLNHLRRKAG